MPGMRVSFSVFSLYILGFQPLARRLIAANTAQATLARGQLAALWNQTWTGLRSWQSERAVTLLFAFPQIPKRLDEIWRFCQPALFAIVGFCDIKATLRGASTLDYSLKVIFMIY